MITCQFQGYSQRASFCKPRPIKNINFREGYPSPIFPKFFPFVKLTRILGYIQKAHL